MQVFRRFSKEICHRLLDEACEATRIEVAQNIGFVWLEELSPVGVQAWKDSWLPNIDMQPPIGGWDWAAIQRMHAQSEREFIVSLWSQNQVLCGLSFLRITGKALRFEIVEGNPDVNHPLKRSVLPIMLDVAARFGQRLRKRRLLAIDPHPKMAMILDEVFGFEIIEERNGSVLGKREI